MSSSSFHFYLYYNCWILFDTPTSNLYLRILLHLLGRILSILLSSIYLFLYNIFTPEIIPPSFVRCLSHLIPLSFFLSRSICTMYYQFLFFFCCKFLYSLHLLYFFISSFFLFSVSPFLVSLNLRMYILFPLNLYFFKNPPFSSRSLVLLCIFVYHSPSLSHWLLLL